jgi:hypothetical protein
MEESSVCDVINSIDASVVEKLWQDLEGRASRDQIGRTVTEIAAQFQDARVTTFVPIFIHRRALEQLRGLRASSSYLAAGNAPADDKTGAESFVRVP